MGYLDFFFKVLFLFLYISCTSCNICTKQKEKTPHFFCPHHDLSYSLGSLVLSIRLPSSACSATVKSGNLAGMMRRGVAPGMTLYFEKSETRQ